MNILDLKHNPRHFLERNIVYHADPPEFTRMDRKDWLYRRMSESESNQIPRYFVVDRESGGLRAGLRRFLQTVRTRCVIIRRSVGHSADGTRIFPTSAITRIEAHVTEACVTTVISELLESRGFIVPRLGPNPRRITIRIFCLYHPRPSQTLSSAYIGRKYMIKYAALGDGEQMFGGKRLDPQDQLCATYIANPGVIRDLNKRYGTTANPLCYLDQLDQDQDPVDHVDQDTDLGEHFNPVETTERIIRAIDRDFRTVARPNQFDVIGIDTILTDRGLIVCEINTATVATLVTDAEHNYMPDVDKDIRDVMNGTEPSRFFKRIQIH